jgi:hypothetical protein
MPAAWWIWHLQQANTFGWQIDNPLVDLAPNPSQQRI